MFISILQINCPSLVLSFLYCSPPKGPWFPFLDSVVTPGYVLTSEDLKLRIIDGSKQVTFVYLDLGC